MRSPEAQHQQSLNLYSIVPAILWAQSQESSSAKRLWWTLRCKLGALSNTSGTHMAFGLMCEIQALSSAMAL